MKKKQRNRMMRATVRRFGFTLTEMLVVVAIVVLLSTMVLPAFTKMLQSNRASTAKVMVRTLLARAQAYAVSHQKYAGIRFQFDRDGWQQGRQYMVLIEKAPAGGTTYEYNAVPDVKTVTLPEGVGVLDLTVIDNGTLNQKNDNLDDEVVSFADGNSGGLLDATTFSILFSPTGQLVTKNIEIRERNIEDTIFGNEAAVLTDPVLVTDPPAPLLYYDDNLNTLIPSWPLTLGDSVAWCITEPSATGFYIFEMEAMVEVDPLTRFTDYISTMAPFLVNRYTAGLIEE